jgi:hypothetical protein
MRFRSEYPLRLKFTDFLRAHLADSTLTWPLSSMPVSSRRLLRNALMIFILVSFTDTVCRIFLECTVFQNPHDQMALIIPAFPELRNFRFKLQKPIKRLQQVSGIRKILVNHRCFFKGQPFSSSKISLESDKLLWLEPTSHKDSECLNKFCFHVCVQNGKTKRPVIRFSTACK